ncbi:MAG TPA: methionyl-tRNA formyltransferase [Methylomirabilota bacterium]|nr:methionyl-tRNA formyltransferase [Methylomirabilota bacterium]
MAGIGRVAFLGTGAFGVPLLPRLVELASELLVVSQPDRPAGRGLQVRRTPVSAWAVAHGVRVKTPRRLRSDDGRAVLTSFAPDGLILVDYGQLVPPDVLEIGSRPPLNVHPSLLPRHRGATPVAATILAGDVEAGVTLMVMTAELDAGPVVAQWSTTLTGRETTPELEAHLADLAARVVPPQLERWAAGEVATTPQDADAATYTRPFTRGDGWIDWRRPARELDRQVRGLQPWPGAWTTLAGRRLHVRRARVEMGPREGGPGAVLPGDLPRVVAGEGTLVLETVQPEGRPAMPADAWRHGRAGGESLVLGAVGADGDEG